MRSNPADLPAELAEAIDRVHARLSRLGSTILHFSTIGSTNDVALALAAHAEREGAVVIADEQTSGRGRRGRRWFSPPGSGLYVSVVLAPGRARAEPDRAATLVTLAAGVAIAEGIETATGLGADLKWPNDLLVGPRKLAGILAEATSTGGACDPIILGFGINVGPTAYPPELGDRATSLETELGRPIDRSLVCAESLAALAARYDDLLAGRFDAILDAWRARAPGHAGARVTWPSPDGPQAGVTAGVDDRGALLVKVGDRMERVVSGEVTWL